MRLRYTLFVKEENCLFLNMVDSFWALFFNTCLPVRIWLTASSEYS